MRCGFCFCFFFLIFFCFLLGIIFQIELSTIFTSIFYVAVSTTNRRHCALLLTKKLIHCFHQRTHHTCPQMLQLIGHNVAFMLLHQTHRCDCRKAKPTTMSVLVVLLCCVALAVAGIGKLKDQPVNLKQLAGSRATMYTLEDTREHRFRIFLCFFLIL